MRIFFDLFFLLGGVTTFFMTVDDPNSDKKNWDGWKVLEATVWFPKDWGAATSPNSDQRVNELW